MRFITHGMQTYQACDSNKDGVQISLDASIFLLFTLVMMLFSVYVIQPKHRSYIFRDIYNEYVGLNPIN